MAKLPAFSNCVRVKLDFILEFEDTAEGVVPLLGMRDIHAFISAGVFAMIPKAVLKKRFGDARIWANAHVSVMQLMKWQAEQAQRAIDKLRKENGLGPEVKAPRGTGGAGSRRTTAKRAKRK